MPTIAKKIGIIAVPLQTLAFACAVVFTAGQATADDAKLPERRAGLWEMTTSMDEGRGPSEQSMKICIDAEMERNTVRHSMEHQRKNCSSYNVENGDGKTTVDAECTFNERRVNSRTVMSGDFNKTFYVEINSTTSDRNESTGQTFTVKRAIKQTGKYLDEACGDLKPGQAVAEGGEPIFVQ